MKNKFIRILSPITIFIVLVLDAGIISFGIYAIKKIQASANTWTILFVIIEILAFILAIFINKEVLSNGVRFDESTIEFTGLDDNNVFEYREIKRIEVFKDTKASFKKNLVDRFSTITFYLKGEKTVTVNIGLTTKRKLNKIKAEIEKRTLD